MTNDVGINIHNRPQLWLIGGLNLETDHKRLRKTLGEGVVKYVDSEGAKEESAHTVTSKLRLLSN